MPADGMVHPFGLIPAPSSDGMSNLANDQSQLSRSSSINDAGRDADEPCRARLWALPAQRGSFDQSYSGVDSNNINANINPQLANYSMPQSQNGLPMFGGSNSGDWSQMFQAGAQTAPTSMPSSSLTSDRRRPQSNKSLMEPLPLERTASLAPIPPTRPCSPRGACRRPIRIPINTSPRRSLVSLYRMLR